ncbi:hypothetical protein ACFLW9_02555 [Chloroflexota bacterium]
MQEKWQKAINHWDKWRDSVESNRENLLKEYGDLQQLEDRMLDLSYQADTGSLPQNLVPELRKLSMNMWDIFNKVDSIGVKFLQDNLGLTVGGYLKTFLEYYTHSVIPELTKGWDDKTPLEEYLFNNRLKHIWHRSEIDKERRPGEIIDTISWYRGKANPEEIMRLIKDELLAPIGGSLWPSREEILAKEKGGAPEKGEKELEAIVCSVLTHEQGMKQKEIQSIFEWGGRRKKKYENIGRVSNTVRDRIKLGDEILGVRKE